MKIYENTQATDWPQLLARPALDLQALETPVGEILHEVAQRGDEALLNFTARFDRVQLAELRVSPAEMTIAAESIEAELQQAIQTAAQNIRRFHAAQTESPKVVETMPGVRCWRKSVGIEKVGLYIPGGTAPLFSTVLMLAIPAQLAQCQEIVLCTPPRKDGTVHPAILYAAQLAGVTQIFKVGGAQAIGAMAYGTETVPRVYKIFGPGNAYVTVAKQMVSRLGTAIDMPAGPSEVLVVADDGANPAYVAIDLLSQAEHGHDSQVVLLTYSRTMAERVLAEVERQMAELPRRELAAQSIANSVAIVVKDDVEALAVLNAYAPEHLILALADPHRLVPGIINAGSVFMGYYTPESVGDYASGTNHTLPTNGFARAYSGVSLDSFVRKITYQELSPAGLKAIGPAVATMAAAEELTAHEKAVTLRLADLPAVSAPKISFVQRAVRPGIANLRPYSSARSEFSGQAEVYLDANENPYNTGLNRYPDPLAKAVKAKLSSIKGVAPEQIVLGNGSDEMIDLVYRIFCEPGQDRVITLPPTYGMYRVSADTNQVEVVEVPLLPGFVPDVEAILAAADDTTKVLWLCTPNNPSGNDFPEETVHQLIAEFPGLVVIDEAYIDFAGRASYAQLLDDHPNLLILQTFSKAWGLAGIRLGMAFASPELISIFNAVKPPYNVNSLSQREALRVLAEEEQFQQKLVEVLDEREKLNDALSQLDVVEEIFPSAANFLLVKVNDPRSIYNYLMEKGIIVRDRSKQYLCGGCLRFTVGTPEENQRLVMTLRKYTGLNK